MPSLSDYAAATSAEPEALGIDGEIHTSGNISNDINITSNSLVIQNENSDMYKVSLSDYNLTNPVELSPKFTHHPKVKPFYIQMVDKNLRSVGIVMQDGVVVSSLKLYPTPSSINITSSKMINRYNTMTRWVEEHWGDDIDVLNISGSTFSFNAYNVPGVPNVGLTTKYRNDTLSFQMLKEMERIFKSNGLIYQDNKTFEGANTSYATQVFLADNTNSYFVLNHPRTGMIKERVYINIYFDYISVTGYFESFDILEQSTIPYRLTYNATFKAERTKYIQGSRAVEDTEDKALKGDFFLNPISIA